MTKEIALRFTATALTPLTYSSGASDQTTFLTTKRTNPVVNTTEEGGVLLSGRKFNHVKWVHKDIQVVISADEIDATVLTFLQNFWCGAFKYISIWNGSAWGDYIQVMTDGGQFPVSYADDLIDLPEVAFNLSYANPV